MRFTNESSAAHSLCSLATGVVSHHEHAICEAPSNILPHDIGSAHCVNCPNRASSHTNHVLPSPSASLTARDEARNDSNMVLNPPGLGASRICASNALSRNDLQTEADP